MGEETDNQMENIRHSLAHLLAAAVRELWPGSKNAIGPAIENGFYQDFEAAGTITDADLPKIEARMREILPKWTSFEKKEVTKEQALKEFKWNEYKTELIKEFSAAGKKITFHNTPTLVDLCKGGHVEHPSKEIDPEAFKLTHVAGAYWRGSEKNPMLTRIYGVAFKTKKELEAHLEMLEEAKRRDHKKLGSQLDLFTFSDLVGSGLPLWTPKGALLRNLLDEFVWKLREARGYERVEIPHITKKELYITSGHWEKFKDELFNVKTREGHEFAIKPMNCPHHTQIYARRQWSYRDLPQRYANTTACYRDEQTGELAGLSRVRGFTQDDAHVFCRFAQAKDELLKIWGIVHEFYSAFGFKLRLRLSLHDPKSPEKYLGSKKNWKEAETVLREVAESKQADFTEALGEAAFYGPKLDFMATDSLEREWQVATIQLDMNMPERFDLSVINEKGESERIVMLHAAIMGSIERFLSILIEHYAGAFPVWLAPVQAAVLPVGEKFGDYAQNITDILRSKNIRVEIHDANETLGKRIRNAEMQKIPYVLVVGDKEKQNKSVSIRHYHSSADARKREAKPEGEMKLESFMEAITEEIEGKD